MRKRLLGIIFILVPVLAAMFSFVACSKSGKYKVTFDTDITKYNIGYWRDESKTFTAADLNGKSISLYGFDIYDYSDVKVLLNGEENRECFVSNYQKPENIIGTTVNVGVIELKDIDCDTTVTITGAKDLTVKIAFVDATDDRLGDDKLDLSTLTSEEQSAYRTMMRQFATTFKTKVSDADYQYLQSLGIDEQYIAKDDYGYISALGLLSEDRGNVLYETDNPDYTGSGDEPETLPVYSPYFFSYKAADLFRSEVVTFYTYIKESSGSDGFEGTFNGKPDTGAIPEGAKEYVYQGYSYNDGSSFSGVGLFPVISEKGNGYYKFDSDYSGSFAVNNVYRAAAGKSESIVDTPRDNIYPYTVFTDGDIAESADDPDRLYDYFKFGISLYEQNLVVLDFSYMSENSPRLNLNNLYASTTDDGGSSIDSLGSADTDRTFRLSYLGDVYGVSDIDFSNARIYVQGAELKGDKGSYRYVPAQDQEDEYFEVTIKAGVLPLSFYTVEQLADEDLFKSEGYELTVDNIDFSEAQGVTQVKVSCNSSSGSYEVNATFSFDFVYGWYEDGAYCYYMGDTLREYVGQEPSYPDVMANFSYYDASKITGDPRLIVKKDGVEILNIDVLAKANEMKGSVVQQYDNVIQWTQDGVTVNVSCWNVDSGSFESEFLSTIEVRLSSDGTTDLWEIIC